MKRFHRDRNKYFMLTVDSSLQDLMTFTTKAEEDRLLASSKQVSSSHWFCTKHLDFYLTS